MTLGKFGEYKGKWYACITESERYVGARCLSVHEFETKLDMEDFIHKSNKRLLDFTHTPAIYQIAETAMNHDIIKYLKAESFT